MKRYLILLFIFYYLFILGGCGPKNSSKISTWQTLIGGDYNDYAYYITTSQDGGFLITGKTESFGPNQTGDVYLIKLTQDGTVTWTKNYGGSNYDYAYSVIETIDKNIVLAGRTASFTTNNNGQDDMYVIKTNPNGEVITSSTFGGGSYDIGSSIKEINNGFILVGSTGSFGNGSNDIYLLELDQNLSCTWSITYGGLGHDMGECVEKTNDNGFIVAGESYSSTTNYDIVILKFNSLNNTWTNTWIYTYTGNEADYAFDIKETSDGGYIIVGQTKSNGAINYDAFVLKINSDGKYEWSYRYGGNGDDTLYSVIETEDGYLSVGYSTSYNLGGYDVYLLKIDKDGNYKWHKIYGGAANDLGRCIVKSQDGGFVIAGFTQSFGNGNADVYVIKIDKEGNTSPLE